MIAEIVQRLNKMFGKPEVIVWNKFIWSLKDMGHLQSDGLYQAFGMLCQFTILRGRWASFWSNRQDFLNLFQSFNASDRIAAEYTRDCNCYVIRSIWLGRSGPIELSDLVRQLWRSRWRTAIN